VCVCGVCECVCRRVRKCVCVNGVCENAFVCAVCLKVGGCV